MQDGCDGGWRRLRTRAAAAVLASAGAWVCVTVGAVDGDAMAGTARRATPDPMMRFALEPLRRGDVERLEIETRDVRQTRPVRRALTDLLVEIEAARGGLAEALAAVSGRGPAVERRLLRLRLSVVSGGRLIRDTLAWCGGFEGVVARCEADCAGGGFALRRQSEDGRRLALVVGGEADVTERERGVRLQACRAEGGVAQWLVPKGSAGAEVELSGE